MAHDDVTGLRVERRKGVVGAPRAPYDESTDTLSVVLKEGVQVHESDEDKPGIILDCDADGDLVSLEILDASRRVTDTRRIEFELPSAEPA